MSRLILGVCVAALFGFSTLSEAAIHTWTSPDSGNFNDPANWMPAAVPSVNDTAIFATDNFYTVTFDNSVNPLPNPVENHGLRVTAGNVFFVSGVDGTYTYRLTGPSGGDAEISTGRLSLGGAFPIQPLNLIVDDELVVHSVNSPAGQLNVLGGSQVDAGSLTVGGLSGPGNIFVEGSDNRISVLNVSGDTVIGRGTVNFNNGAQGNLSTQGTVDFRGSGQDSFRIDSGADVAMGSLRIATNTLGTSNTVFVSGAGSTLTQLGAATLDIGSTGAGQVTGSLSITSGTHTMGTGVTNIHGRGGLVISSGRFTTSGDINVNSNGDLGTNASIMISNNNVAGVLTQLGNTNITVGSAHGGAASISLSSSNLITGSGLFTINKSGTVTIGSSLGVIANGDVLVNGGVVSGSSAFLLAPGRTMTIQNGGRASLFDYTTSAATYRVDGIGSRLESTSSGSDLLINNGGRVEVTNGGLLSYQGLIEVGSTVGGSLTMDGFGSAAKSNGIFRLGHSGATGEAIFRNEATGTFSNLEISSSSIAGTVGKLRVESGAKVTVNQAILAAASATAGSATTTIAGAGSSLSVSSAILGHADGTAADIRATINLEDGGELVVRLGGNTQLRPNAVININGGKADLKQLNNPSGKINFQDGSLSFIGNLTIGSEGLLGAQLELGATKRLSLIGMTIINSGSKLFLDEGADFATAGLNNSGEIVLDEPSSVATPQVFNGGAIRGRGRVASILNNASTGQLRAGAGDALRFSGANHSNAGHMEAIGNAIEKAELEFTGTVVNSGAAAAIVGRNSVLRFNDGLTNAGSLLISTGISDVFGDIDNTGSIVVSGGATATFYDDLVQNGVLHVSASGSTNSVAVFFGTVSGSAGASGGGDIFFEGGLQPGNSPAAVTFNNNVSLGGGGFTRIEIGGVTPGTEYDRINVVNSLSLGGALELSLIDGFTPSAGQSFDILDWGSLDGTFSSLFLPALPGLAWDTSELYISGEISLVESVLLGDYNFDGVVDAADYVVWRRNDGTEDGYNLWRVNLGSTSGTGAGAGSAAGDLVDSAVPEPSTLFMVACAAASVFVKRSGVNRR